MDAFLQQFEHLKIQMEDIISATNNFDDENNRIGGGGFGKVYKGEVSHSKGRSMVAIKRLDPNQGQGIPEFLKEISTLSRYNHENLISLLGYCYEGNEMILVYEHAYHGSLDGHLNSPLTWRQRLKICLDAAKGLGHLHDPREKHQRLVHCDIKSANILLDDQWSAKISDFGLSIMGSANEQHSVIVNFAAGTHGYCDPEYKLSHTLTKESDVYSFGVVLFEVLCGTLCNRYNITGKLEEYLVPTWTKSYEQKMLDNIIFKNPSIQPLDQSSLEIYSDIAYRCLKKSREDRPKMDEVVTELENALENQELFESQEFREWKAHDYYEKLIKTAKPPVKYRSKAELLKLLHKGVFLNDRKTLLSINKKGEHCETISIQECIEDPRQLYGGSEKSTRFPNAIYMYRGTSLRLHVTPRFLSPGITYTMSLVFRFAPYVRIKRYCPIFLKYRLQADTIPPQRDYKFNLQHTKTSISYLAYEREDGWWMCELYQFTSSSRTLDILFEDFSSISVLGLEGFEFWPLEVDHTDKNQPMMDSNSIADLEEKLPNDYQDVIKLSKDNVQWTTKKEAYSILCKGFLINDGKELFFLNNNGKKCHMLSAGAACVGKEIYPFSSPESRFGEAFGSDSQGIDIDYKIDSQLLSLKTTYAIYLVYKLREDQSELEAPIEVKDLGSGDNSWYVYLISPQTPFVGPNGIQITHNPLNRPKIKDLPLKRNDGWMEVQIFEFQTATKPEIIPLNLVLRSCDKKDIKFSGLVIEGLEFRPL